MKTRITVVLVASALLVDLPGSPVAAGPQKQQPSLRGNLRLNDLTPAPTEKLDEQLFSPSTPPGPAQGPGTDTQRGPSSLDQQLQQELGRAGRSEEDSPLVDIARTMHEVQQRIEKANSGAETQQMQQRILTNLDSLLQQARRQCQACQGACQPGQQTVAPRERIEQPKDLEPSKQVKRKNSGGGADPSKAMAGPDKVAPGMKAIHQPNMEEMRSLLKSLWGELPERQREQMLQLPVEEFLPKYELLIEQYFKRLSEQQPQPPEKPAP